MFNYQHIITSFNLHLPFSANRNLSTSNWLYSLPATNTLFTSQLVSLSWISQDFDNRGTCPRTNCQCFHICEQCKGAHPICSCPTTFVGNSSTPHRQVGCMHPNSISSVNYAITPDKVFVQLLVDRVVPLAMLAHSLHTQYETYSLFWEDKLCGIM